ncbi:hypothetical protein I6J72_05600 [Corynebacterium sp. FDAARGOS 1242]|uniref:hypothetical protein n=1 Tax=Corynebacterium sp. FDAARGOS 1242 TaxID=2778078 RepID=UPI00194E2D57|nr:hypothetical protein [Corynebacterium sp. FDAARGOS 1242]QRP98975.1 hypothetical protein I6J72_05600 [Corynebacterium sp. FDAARGOS 1242]
MMNDESNRAFSLAEVRQFMNWCDIVQQCISQLDNFTVSKHGPLWIGRKLDEAWEKIDECFEWASIYEFELLEESE